MFRLVPILAYLTVAGMALDAAARSDRVPFRARAIWAAVTLLFIALAASRLWDWEVGAQAWLRGALRNGGLYDSRQSFQKPLAALAVATTVFVSAGWWAITRGRRRSLDACSRVAGVAALAMIGLVGLRTVSLHSIDRVLYARPIHGNWILDLGLTAIVAWCAWRLRSRDGRDASRTTGAEPASDGGQAVDTVRR